MNKHLLVIALVLAAAPAAAAELRYSVDKVVGIAPTVEAYDSEALDAPSGYFLGVLRHHYVRQRKGEAVEIAAEPLQSGDANREQKQPTWWVRDSDLLRWPTAEGLTFGPEMVKAACDERRDAIQGYADSSADALRQIASSGAVRPGFFREELKVTCALKEQRYPLPLLDSAVLPDGRRFHRVIAPVLLQTVHLERDQASGLKQLDVALVFDLTDSVEPHLERNLRPWLGGVLSELQRLEATGLEVRVGLVAFLGHTRDGHPWVTRKWELMPIPAAHLVIAQFATAGPSERANAGAPAAALDGVDTALQKLDWHADSMKFIVLFAHSAGIEPTVGSELSHAHHTVRMLRDELVRQNFLAYGAQIGGSGETILGARVRRQFNDLVAGTGGKFYYGERDADPSRPLAAQFRQRTRTHFAEGQEGRAADPSVIERLIKAAAEGKPGVVIFAEARDELGQAQYRKLIEQVRRYSSDLLSSIVWIPETQGLVLSVLVTEAGRKQLHQALDEAADRPGSDARRDLLHAICQVVAGNPANEADTTLDGLYNCVAGIAGDSRPWRGLSAAKEAGYIASTRAMASRIAAWSRTQEVRQTLRDHGAAWLPRSTLDPRPEDAQ